MSEVEQLRERVGDLEQMNRYLRQKLETLATENKRLAGKYVRRKVRATRNAEPFRNDRDRSVAAD